MDRFGRLVELCYTGTDSVESVNLSFLVGLHSAFMNGLVRRGEAVAKGHLEGGFPGGDLVTFFREPWALPMYEETFLLFAEGLRDLLTGDASLEGLWHGLKGILAGAKGGDTATLAAVDLACSEAVNEGVGVSGTSLPVEVRTKLQGAVKNFLQTLF